MFAIASLLMGCKANFPVAQQTGKEDMAYLLFVGQKEYCGKEVQVTIDNAEPFAAKVVMTGGDTPETEYSFVEVTSDETIDSTNMSNYIIEQAK